MEQHETLRRVVDSVGGISAGHVSRQCSSCAVCFFFLFFMLEENANHCYINCIDTIGLVVLFCLLLRSFAFSLHTFFSFNLDAERVGRGVVVVNLKGVPPCLREIKKIKP